MFSEDLSKGSFIEIVSKCHNEKAGKEEKLHEELSITYGIISMSPNFKLYYIGNDGRRCYLSDDEIKESLTNYAASRGFALDSFTYIGGVRRMGMFTDEDTPYFTGVLLNLKERELDNDSSLVRKRKINE